MFHGKRTAIILWGIFTVTTSAREAQCTKPPDEKAPVALQMIPETISAQGIDHKKDRPDRTPGLEIKMRLLRIDQSITSADANIETSRRQQ